jgi:hypothetical protein
MVAEAYLSVPAEFLAQDGAKERLNLALLRDTGLRDNLLRGKVRAQVGSSDGGTLGLFHEAGITQQTLIERWQSLFAPTVREGGLDPVIVGGRYRH